MSTLKRAKGLCLAGLCLSSMLALGAAGTAAAANTLLFERNSGKFPYHLVGLKESPSTFETVDNEKFVASTIHMLMLVLDKTLFDAHILFLGFNEEGTGSCSNLGGTPKSGDVLIALLGHLGFTDPGRAPAVLLLVPSGFAFECIILGVRTTAELLGSVIGLITHPDPLVSSEELGLIFIQANGVQTHTLFLLPNGVVMANQLLDIAKGGGGFLQAGLSTSQTLLKALPNEGSFLLRDE